jgi:hypothetical protein
MAKVRVVTSGKGGVGKTTSAAALSGRPSGEAPGRKFRPPIWLSSLSANGEAPRGLSFIPGLLLGLRTLGAVVGAVILLRDRACTDT